MFLLGKINQDLKSALKNRDIEKTAVLRFILAQVQNKSIEKRGTGDSPELSDEEVTQVLQKEFKKRKEAIELFKKGGRNDLADKETSELKFFEGYLPVELSRDEIMKVVEKVMAGGGKDFGVLMKEAMKELKGQADGKIVSELVREKLSGSGTSSL
ncbi:MAG: GatB/YqeY domain-containing protein [bacterium]|nr:GatB/YqeY domain-containing protein [bacterium]